MFYLIRCERDIFSVLACQEKGEEHGFCEQRNICPKAERQEVIVLFLMLDLKKPPRKKKKNTLNPEDCGRTANQFNKRIKRQLIATNLHSSEFPKPHFSSF